MSVNAVARSTRVNELPPAPPSPKRRKPPRRSPQASWQLERAKEEAAARAERERLYWPGMGYDERDRDAIDEFLKYWTPERMIRGWRREVAQFGIDPDNVLQTIDLVVRPPEGHGYISTWPYQYLVRWLPKRQSVNDAREALQARVARMHSLGQLAGWLVDGSKGEIYTIDHLVRAKGDPNRVAATLLCASLFQRVEGRRTYREENWPRHVVLQVVLKWARQFHDCEWHSACTTVLPGPMTTTPVASMDNLIEAFAIEHARTLHRCTPVHFRLVTENGEVVHPDPREEQMRERDEARDAEAAADAERQRVAQAENPEEPRSASETATERALRRLRGIR